IRGAAVIPDGSGQSPVPQARLERHRAQVHRDAVRRSLHLGRDRGYPAESLRADLRRMIRPILTELALFLLPFVVYALFLVVTRSTTLYQTNWMPKTLMSLTSAALLLVSGSFALFAHFSGSPPGSDYEPAHMEDGRFVPGRVR